MRSRSLLAAIIFLSSTMAIAQQIQPAVNVSQEKKVGLPVRENKTSRAVLAKLETVTDDIRFSDTKLSNAVDQLHDKTGLNIFVNWRALDRAGVDRDTPITLHVTKVKFSAAIDLLLTVAATGKEKLGYIIDDGVITISTQEDLTKNTVTRVYDVRDIINGKNRDAKVPALIDFVTTQVDPDSWRDPRPVHPAGQTGSMRELQGQLIITQTPDAHDRIHKLLDGLRKIASAGEPPATQPFPGLIKKKK